MFPLGYSILELSMFFHGPWTLMRVLQILRLLCHFCQDSKLALTPARRIVSSGWSSYYLGTSLASRGEITFAILLETVNIMRMAYSTTGLFIVTTGGWFFKHVILMGRFIMCTSHVLIINRCCFSVNCHQLVENNIRCTLYWYMPC